MNGPKKSDLAIVATKLVNAGAQASVELVEPRAGAEGNTLSPHTDRAQVRQSVLSGEDTSRITPYRPTPLPSPASAITWPISGIERSGGAARRTRPRGKNSPGS